jgi:hypothetical protein
MSENLDEWSPFNGGRSLGLVGSESGVILLDDEFVGGARITMERDCKSAPFAITCGVPGWMVHTRFFPSEADAQAEYEKMKTALATLTRVLDVGDLGEAGDACAQFVATFPT